MRTAFFSSLLFALLTATSVTATAAAAENPMMDAPVMDASGTGSAAMSDSMAHENMMGKVNLNTADAATLQKELAGIGQNKAQAIVAYREANGQFTSIDELIEVKGIGKAILDKNRDKLVVQ